MADPQQSASQQSGPQQVRPQPTGRIRLSRLKRRADFLRVAGQRRKWVTPGVMLQVAASPPDRISGQAAAQTDLQDEAQVQVGFTASRKVGNAVTRNRARRRLKAVVDEVMPLYAKPGFDYVLIARRDTATRPYALLIEDLKLALRKTGAFRTPALRAEGETS